MKINALCALILCFLSLSAPAATLDKLFRETWYTGYVKGECGQNIMNLLKRAEQENINVSGARIIYVAGGWVEPRYVRNGGHTARAEGPAGITRPPGPKYFYYHAFLIHRGKVYDFDYGNRPVVPSVKTYFDRMWLNPKPRLSIHPGLEVHEAQDFLAGRPMGNKPTINIFRFFLKELFGPAHVVCQTRQDSFVYADRRISCD